MKAKFSGQLLIISFIAGLIILSAGVSYAAPSGVQPVQGAETQLKISDTLEGKNLEFLPAQGDLWPRIRAGFNMPVVSPQLVRTHENWFMRHAQSLESVSTRSRPYLYHVVEEVERRGMPMEIALLPFIESAYNPQATSPRKAAGIWQFIPSTGKMFGLKQDEWVDNRRDVNAATDAALDYLQKLYNQFGRWDLALAGYNCGEGCIERVLKKQRRLGKSTDYEALPLPLETRHYVPKLIALRNIVQRPQQYGIQLTPIANEPYFMQVSLKQTMTAQSIARLADMSLDEFNRLNPAFRRRVVSDTTTLLLPADRLETFHYNLQRSGNEDALQAYPGHRGEALTKIADRFGVTLNWLKEHNIIKTGRSGSLSRPQSIYVPAQPQKPAGKNDLQATRTTENRAI